jgi:predicted nucleic acid-binding protein
VAFLIDTSALIHVLRDKTGLVGVKYDSVGKTDPVYLSRVTAFELLKGAHDAAEWTRLEQLLGKQSIQECSEKTWTDAARIVFDMRRTCLTLKNPIDALIAQTALEYSLTVVHDD